MYVKLHVKKADDMWMRVKVKVNVIAMLMLMLCRDVRGHVTCECACVQVAGDASKVKVYGPAVEAPVALHQLSYLIVDCKEAGPGARLSLHVRLSLCVFVCVCLCVSVCVCVCVYRAYICVCVWTMVVVRWRVGDDDHWPGTGHPSQAGRQSRRHISRGVWGDVRRCLQHVGHVRWSIDTCKSVQDHCPTANGSWHQQSPRHWPPWQYVSSLIDPLYTLHSPLVYCPLSTLYCPALTLVYSGGALCCPLRRVSLALHVDAMETLSV